MSLDSENAKKECQEDRPDPFCVSQPIEKTNFYFNVLACKKGGVCTG
jgi:hypothetical protein